MSRKIEVRETEDGAEESTKCFKEPGELNKSPFARKGLKFITFNPLPEIYYSSAITTLEATKIVLILRFLISTSKNSLT